MTNDKNGCVYLTDGPPLSWWVGGPGVGQVQTHWGGALQGSKQCACGLQQNCVDPKHHCNCDADHTEWYCILTHINLTHNNTKSFFFFSSATDNDNQTTSFDLLSLL